MNICIRLVLILVAGISLTGMELLSSPKPFHYVALGDSLTVGYEWGNEVPYGFVDRLHEQALYKGRAMTTNYGIVGLTSTGLKHQLEAVIEEKPVQLTDIQAELSAASPAFLADPKQVKQDLEEAQLVTITIGGNDFKQFPFQLQGKTAEETRAFAAKGIVGYKQNLKAALDMIYELNPQARVVVAGAYQPIPAYDPALYENLKLAADIWNEQLEIMNQEFQQQNRMMQIAPIGDPFKGKELAFTHIAQFNVHPNQSGYEEMAKAFAQVIWGSYQAPANREPVDIVFSGKEFTSPHSPKILQDRVYVPLREYAETLGAEVKWDQESKKVLISYQHTTIQVQSGSDKLSMGSKEIVLPAPVQLISSKTYVPLRVLAEGFGLDISYQAKSRTVYINS